VQNEAAAERPDLDRRLAPHARLLGLKRVAGGRVRHNHDPSVGRPVEQFTPRARPDGVGAAARGDRKLAPWSRKRPDVDLDGARLGRFVGQPPTTSIGATPRKLSVGTSGNLKRSGFKSRSRKLPDSPTGVIEGHFLSRYLGIFRRDTRPSNRQRPRLSIGAHVHDAVFAPVKPIGQQRKRLPVQRMERVRDRENLWQMGITGCTARLLPMRTRSGSCDR
jgi:hypothetical protein